jgi:AcrR family transcriptional regulator
LEEVKQDGRLKRSIRSRQTIIDAMLVLTEQGQYIPTAQQVADQANISIRTVFRHFTEMEHLYKELDDAVRPSYEKYFMIDDVSGPLDERIEQLVQSRLNAYQETFHINKASHALFWRSALLTETYQKNQKLLRTLMLKALPELKDKHIDIIEMADAITSFEVFDRYFTYQQLPIEECERLFIAQLKQLVLD